MTEGTQAAWAIMYDTLEEVLGRTRNIHPLKVSHYDLLEPILPRDFIYGSNDLRWQNAHRATRFGRTLLFEVKGFDHDMWLTAPADLPVPVGDEGFIIPREHPRYDDIAQWMAQAVRVEESLVEMRDWLHKVMRGLGGLPNVKKHFREVVPYLTPVKKELERQARLTPSRPAEHLFVLEDDRGMKRMVIDQLALGALSPRLDITAWVGDPQI